jgi:branched-chain amino acid transport system permease protein
MTSKLSALRPRREYATALAIVVVLFLGVLWSRESSNTALVGQSILVLLACFGELGLNVVTGYAGQASMGNGGFMGIGAMTAWYLQDHGHGFVLAVVAGMVAGFVVGAAVGAVALRWRGFYLVLATLAVQFIVVFAIEHAQLNDLMHTAGYTFTSASVFGHPLADDSDWFLLLAIVLSVLVLMVAGLLNGPLGRAWMALRENENAAAVAGVNVVWVKVLAFAISCGVIALGGALGGFYAGAIGYQSYPLSIAVSYVAMLIVGGVGSMAGPFLGAFAVTMIPYWINAMDGTGWGSSILEVEGKTSVPYLEVLAYCVIVLLFLALEPRGLAALGPRAVHLVRRVVRRTSADPAASAPAAGADPPTDRATESSTDDPKASVR